MFIHLRGPHTGENGVSIGPLHRKTIHPHSFFRSVQYPTYGRGKAFLRKKRYPLTVFDVSTTSSTYAAYIQVKIVPQLSHCVGKYRRFRCLQLFAHISGTLTAKNGVLKVSLRREIRYFQPCKVRENVLTQQADIAPRVPSHPHSSPFRFFVLSRSRRFFAILWDVGFAYR